MSVAVPPERSHRLVARHRAGTQRAKEIGLVLDDGAVRLLGRGERKPRDTGRVVDGKLPEKGRMIGDPKKKVAKESFVEMLQEGSRLAARRARG